MEIRSWELWFVFLRRRGEWHEMNLFRIRRRTWLAERVDNELGFRQTEQWVSNPWREVWQVPVQVTVMGYPGVISKALSLSSMSRCITKQELQLLENWSKTNTSMGIFRSFNVAYIENKQAFLPLSAKAHHAVRVWNLQLRHLTGFKENIIIWKPCKENRVCMKKWHHPPL